MKINKLVSLEPAIIEHIKQNKQISSFSSWIETTYKNEFMKIETLKEKKAQIQKELNEWNIKKQEFKMNELKKESVIEHIYGKLTDKSKFYLLRVPELILKGYDERTIHKSFCNNDLKYNITIEEFRNLVEHNKKNCKLNSPVAPLN